MAKIMMYRYWLYRYKTGWVYCSIAKHAAFYIQMGTKYYDTFLNLTITADRYMADIQYIPTDSTHGYTQLLIPTEQCANNRVIQQVIVTGVASHLRRFNTCLARSVGLQALKNQMIQGQLPSSIT